MRQRRHYKGNTRHGEDRKVHHQGIHSFSSTPGTEIPYLLLSPYRFQAPILHSAHLYIKQVCKCGESYSFLEQIILSFDVVGTPLTLGFKSLHLHSNPNTTSQILWTKTGDSKTLSLRFLICKWINNTYIIEFL